ncbi:hypothetical protein SAMN02745174_02084 [Cetobacterium ceti]|uniref:Uncharacterized protein n=1 Tax=Cetobacterium ceti TaxID=180163 RepID=A0A1T4PWB8_9FUSO|nr:hypothetical protein [Cetobacterium ceti]SJZ95860.1 hypothetical protein SAMN02745174_02084 [Cetobacterium ceti]
MLVFIKNNLEILNFLTATFLLIVTIIYVFYTKKILESSILSSNPILGIELKNIIIFKKFEGIDRRQMSIDLILKNLGNSPIIDIYADGEITLNYEDIKGEKTIPQRFEAEFIPFIEIQNENKISLNFGTRFVKTLICDLEKNIKLNEIRIATNPSQESYSGPIFTINVFYKNNLNKTFMSSYSGRLDVNTLRNINEEFVFPGENENIELSILSIPRHKFSTKLITEKEMYSEIKRRDSKRILCGS